jgi:hypothetical protein
VGVRRGLDFWNEIWAPGGDRWAGQHGRVRRKGCVKLRSRACLTAVCSIRKRTIVDGPGGQHANAPLPRLARLLLIVLQVGARYTPLFSYFSDKLLDSGRPPPPPIPPFLVHQQHYHVPPCCCPPPHWPPIPVQVGARYTPLFPYFTDKVAHPGDAFKVVSDTYVTDDSGTGVVHQAPAFGEDDYRWVWYHSYMGSAWGGGGGELRVHQGGMGERRRFCCATACAVSVEV